MSTKIGRFEILGELAKSDSGCVYKANDPESGQTLALKAIRLDVFGEHAEQVVQRILQEAETTKDLSSSNITLVYGAGEIDGQFCAAMEYIQGNSVATMLARKEGFSIWDLLDISRQVCQALDHAHEHNVFHFSLEPAKVMVTWDGTVKILSFGISSTGYVAAQAAGVPPSVLYYMSPEQVRGEQLDARSNLFTWGAVLYEMVTDQKAFDGADADVVRQKILEEMPASPAILNPKINPVASDVIMKALAKNPEERYQSGREMVNDLERARETTVKVAKKAPETPRAPVVPASVKNTAAAKFAGSAPKENRPAAKFEPKAPELKPPDVSASLSDELETSWTPATPAKPVNDPPKKAAAAAAGWNSAGSPSAGRTPQLDPSAQFVTSVVKASVEALEQPSANMSAATVEEPQTPRIAIDPMMAEGAGSAKKSVSFSDLDELPPLKEVYVPPPAPKSEAPEPDEPLPSIILRKSEPEKPKIQPREVAEKALKEIKSVPPQLLMYSIAAAVALILIVSIAVYWRSRSESTDEEGRVPAPVAAPVKPAGAEQPAPQATVPEPAQAAPQAEAPAEPVVEEAPSRKLVPAAKGKFAKNKRNSAPASAAAIPGQLAVESNPQGAQFEIDGRTDPNWITPYTLAGLSPGQHTVTISKSGFASDTRSVDVTSASKATLAVHLTSLNATMNVTSDPPGASIYVDGKDTAKVTPSVITIEKGTHTVLVRKMGYLDETTSAAGQPGQAFHFASTLRPLGNVDDIKTVGKFKKLFGGSGAEAGMGKVSIKTSPKGAQIAINRRILEKASPVNFLLNPGNYIVDITLSGYKPVQKVITVDQGGNVVIDEVLQTP